MCAGPRHWRIDNLTFFAGPAAHRLRSSIGSVPRSAMHLPRNAVIAGLIDMDRVALGIDDARRLIKPA